MGDRLSVDTDGLARAMHQAWISFIRTGDPHHSDLPPWDPYDMKTRTTMRFDSVTLAVGDLAGDARRLRRRAPDEA